ncbi:Transcriptional regulator with sigma factor-related N-terminal domain [Tenacibaculum litopenaei]
MRYLERKLRMEYLLDLIEKGRCHSLKQIASKFECSESTVKRMINELRFEGHNIQYSKSQKCFIKKFS